MTNPFVGRGAPVSGSRLVGRGVVVQRIVERVTAGAHISVVGLPRMGKTSVARQCILEVSKVAPAMICGSISLDAIRGPSESYMRILEELNELDGVDPRGCGALDHDEAYAMLRSRLLWGKRQGRRALIVVDEVDRIVRDDFDDATLFVSRMREIANDYDRYGLTFLFLSRRSLDMIQGEVDFSTLAGLCEVIYLQPLDRRSLDNLAQRAPAPVAREGLDILWALTGGHPFLAEVVMCEAVDTAELKLVSNSIELAQSAQAHEFTNQYRQLAAVLGQDGMFEALCELTVGPRWREISPHTICLLKHYGLISASHDNAGGVSCMSQHLYEYLKLHTRVTPTWYLLGEAERALRIVLNDRLAEVHGSSWMAAMQCKSATLAASLERLMEQMTRERRLFGDAASDFIFDYAYIGDLKDMVFAEWDLFREMLGGTKADWEKRFQNIMRVRNPMAHHRPVPEDVMRDAEGACHALIARLNGVGTTE